MKNETLSHLITNNNIVINFEGRTYNISSSDTAKFKSVKGFLKDKDYESVKEILSPKSKIVRYANTYFEVTDDGLLWMKDDKKEPVPHILAKRLLDFINEGLDFIYLIKFWENLRLNPSLESRKDLYSFLESNHHPITPEGNFIAYKKVTKVGTNLMDSHTKTLKNNVGLVVEMQREKVDANRNNTCSSGLHVAAWEYASTFSGDTLIEVVVNPKDVVAVPTDYKNQKMRVCRYKVLNIVVDTKKDKDGNVSSSERNEILAMIPKDKDLSNNDKDLNKVVNKTVIDKTVIDKTLDLTGYSAVKIKEEVKKITGIQITLSDKNKQGIVKHAIGYLADAGYKVII